MEVTTCIQLAGDRCFPAAPAYHAYPCTEGVLAADAIDVLRRFYVRGNAKAPKPQRAVAARVAPECTAVTTTEGAFPTPLPVAESAAAPSDPVTRSMAHSPEEREEKRARIASPAEEAPELV